MKYTLIIFGLYLVAVSAGPIDKPNVDIEAKIKNILKDVAENSKKAANNLKNQVEEFYVDRLKQVNAAVSAIDDLREINETCVAAEDQQINATVSAMHISLANCGATAVNTSANIVVEISKPAKQLVFDGYDVLRLYRKCKKHLNPVLKNICYSRLTVKGTLYLNNARKSTKAIKETVNDGIPKVKTESKDCANSAVDVAMKELAEIRASIDACIKGE